MRCFPRLGTFNQSGAVFGGNKYNGSLRTWTMACQDLGPY